MWLFAILCQKLLSRYDPSSIHRFSEKEDLQANNARGSDWSSAFICFHDALFVSEVTSFFFFK